MELIDTHTHLFDPRFEADFPAVMARAAAAGCHRCVLPGTDTASHPALIALAEAWPERLFAAMGLHPTSVNDNPRWREDLAVVENYLNNPPVRFWAVGEIGLDLHWSRDWLAEQQEALRFQIELAIAHRLPVLLHSREAFEPMLAVLSDYAGRGLRGIFHSFSGTAEEYRALRRLGDFKFGIAGVVTYKKALIAQTLPEMDPADLVLETDAPYLPPVPYRGQRNESAYLVPIAQKVAELTGLTPDEVARLTTRNAGEVFGFSSFH